MSLDHIVVLRIDRPRQKNILDSDAIRKLSDACLEIESDPSVRCVIITGTGRKYFCTGHKTISDDDLTLKPASSIAGLTVPVIAAINGHALNVGLEIALACDIRIASKDALFGFPGIHEGMIPCDGGTQRLPRLIGRGRAMELLLTGEIIDAARALEMGLVDEVLPATQVTRRAIELATDITAKAPIAVKYAKEAINSGLDLPLEQGLRLEGDLYLLLQTTRDRAEGVMSFRQKRNPKFQGE